MRPPSYMRSVVDRNVVLRRMTKCDCRDYVRMYEWVHKFSADCDVHVTVHRVKFLIIKPTRCTNFSNLFLEWNSACFAQFLCPSSGAFHYTRQWYMLYRFTDSLRAGSGWNILILLASCQQTCMTYIIAVCRVKNSWWWTEELSEKCRVTFQE